MFLFAAKRAVTGGDRIKEALINSIIVIPAHAGIQVFQ
jgi:hypothetical protein